jgi:hypothetical protein
MKPDCIPAREVKYLVWIVEGSPLSGFEDEGGNLNFWKK